MVAADHARNIDRVPALECFDDDLAGILLIGFLDLFRGQVPGARYGTIEIIRMGGSLQGNIMACLRPAGGKCGMGMYNTADLRKCLVQFQMSGGIGRRIQVTLNLVAVHIQDNHIRRLQFLVGYAAGFDHEQSLLTVDAADIAPCKRDKTIFRKLQIRPAHILFQFFKHN